MWDISGFPSNCLSPSATCSLSSVASASVGLTVCLGFVSTGNTAAQLGDGTSTARNGPVSIAGAGSYIDWAQATAGDSHTCTLFSDNSLKCWGKGASGQLGVGTTSTVTSPTVVPGSWSQVAGGATHTCGVFTNGSAACWGTRTNVLTASLSPRVLADAGPWSFVAEGVNEGHVCGVKQGGLYCWCVC